MSQTGVAFIGCGYVANMYRLTLPMHDGLRLVAVHDRDRPRAEAMANATDARVVDSVQHILEDDAVDIVVNLTNPRSHVEVTRASLEADKHVYSEKPLALSLDDAQQLADLAASRRLHLCVAPSTLMSPAAQTLWRAIRDERAGRVRLVYAEMDDGMVPRAPVEKWVNELGVPWPYADEFETGCTIEHAGYVLTWLCACFGPAVGVTAFADVLMPDKLPGSDTAPAADFSVACVRFASGVVARVTNSIYAEHNHAIRVFGDDGVLTVDDPRSDHSPVRLRRYRTVRRKRFLDPWGRKLKPVGEVRKIAGYRGSQSRDFCRVIADMAGAIRDDRPVYMPAPFAVHITELTLAIHHAATAGASATPHEMTTTFEPIEPLPL